MLNGGTNNDLSSSQVVWTWSFVTSGHTLRLRRNKYICLYFVSEGTLNLNCHIWWQQHCRVSGRWDSVITFLFQTLPLSVSLCRLLVVSNAQCIGFIPFFLLPISHLYTWVDRSSFIRLLLQTSSSSSPPHLQPRPASETAVKTVWNLCNPPEKKPGALLLHLPILTRFSRDITGNKRLWHFHGAQKLHPITFGRLPLTFKVRWHRKPGP